MSDFLIPSAHSGRNCPTFIAPQQLPDACRTGLTEGVRVSPTPLVVDEENEKHIRDCGWLMQCAMNRWEQSGCFAARGEADRWRIEMEAAIKARSAAQVALLEQEGGLA